MWRSLMTSSSFFFDGFEPASRQFVARLSNVSGTTPTWSWLRSVPEDLLLSAVAIGPEGDFYAAGETMAPVSLPDPGASGSLAQTGASVTRDGSEGLDIGGRNSGAGRESVSTTRFSAGNFSGHGDLRRQCGCTIHGAQRILCRTEPGRRDLPGHAAIATIPARCPTSWRAGDAELTTTK